MRRRAFVVGLGAAIVGRRARAQVDTIPTIGVLWHARSAEDEGPYFTGLIKGFNEIGYVDQHNIRLEHRFPNERTEAFKRLAAELVARKVDVLVTVGAATAPYAKKKRPAKFRLSSPWFPTPLVPV